MSFVLETFPDVSAHISSSFKFVLLVWALVFSQHHNTDFLMDYSRMFVQNILVCKGISLTTQILLLSTLHYLSLKWIKIVFICFLKFPFAHFTYCFIWSAVSWQPHNSLRLSLPLLPSAIIIIIVAMTLISVCQWVVTSEEKFQLFLLMLHFIYLFCPIGSVFLCFVFNMNKCN